MKNNNIRRSAIALTRDHMPTNHSISLAAYNARGTHIPDDFGPAQSMRGFEETYRNIIDYIVRITYKIWEDRDVEYIGDTYSDSSLVYDDYGLQHGSKKIIADTYHTTGAFSDIRLIADEVVWAGNDESASTRRTELLFGARMTARADTDLLPINTSTYW